MAAVALFAVPSFADYIVRDARIEFADGKVIEKGSVWIKGDRIGAVGDVAGAPKEAEVINGTGLTVYPGFADAYSTRGLKLPDAPAAATPPSNTTTAPPTMWDKNRKGIRAQIKSAECLNLSSLLSDTRANGLTEAFLCPGGSMIRGSGALALLTDDKVAAMPFGMELGFRSGGGGPGGGGGGGAYPGTLLGYLALQRQTLYDAITYSQTDKPKTDADLEALVPLVKNQTPAVIAADTEVEISRALRLSAEFGFRLIISGGKDAYRRADALAKLNVPVLASITVGDEPIARPVPDGAPQGVLDDRKALWRTRADNVKTLMAAGVRVAFSSEGDGASGYLKNVRKLITLGLGRQDALKAMTSNAAAIFGTSDWGDLAPGKLANVVVMDGDFASATTRVRFVFVNGKKFEVGK